MTPLPAGGPTPVLLMVRELGLGGTERQLAEIARALDRAYFEPHVGCFRPEGLRGDELRAARIPVVKFPVQSFYGPSAWTAARRMGRYLRQNRIQLVHAFDVPLNVFGVPAARAFHAPIVMSSQRAYRSLASPLVRPLLRLTDRLADAIVVNCQAIKRHLIEDEHVPEDRIEVCYNGIDTSRFHPAHTQRVPDLRESSLAIGIVCALRPEKGLFTLLDSFARVRDEQPGLKLAIIGSGPLRAALEARSTELGIREMCVFQPATREVPDWLRSLDIFVLPSFSEALSNALMEAMACGCAPVGSRVGGNTELIDEGRTGLLFEAGNPEQLARCLRLLISNSELRRRMGSAAARSIHQNFSLPAAATRMAEIYSRGLASHRAAHEPRQAAAPASGLDYNTSR
jgi:glycosyltransferase involved in cell wall biosynthesis